MAAFNVLDIDERLAAAVRNYPILYDKSQQEFKEKDRKDQAWKEVAKVIGLANGEEAMTMFRNLRNRFTRNKRKVETNDINGVCEVTQVKRNASELFGFLAWLGPYVSHRRSKSSYNIRLLPKSEDDPGDWAYGTSDNGGNESSTCVTPMRDSHDSHATLGDERKVSSATLQATRCVKYCDQPHLRPQDSAHAYDKAEVVFIAPAGPGLKQQAEQKAIKDEDDLFGELIVSQLRKLPPQEKMLTKMKINQITYEQLFQSSSVGGALSPVGGPLGVLPVSSTSATRAYSCFKIPSSLREMPRGCRLIPYRTSSTSTPQDIPTPLQQTDEENA